MQNITEKKKSYKIVQRMIFYVENYCSISEDLEYNKIWNKGKKTLKTERKTEKKQGQKVLSVILSLKKVNKETYQP